MKKKFLAGTLGILLSLSLVMTSYAPVQAADAEVGVQEVVAEKEEEVVEEGETEAVEMEEVEPSEEMEEVALPEEQQEEKSEKPKKEQPEKQTKEMRAMVSPGEVVATQTKTPTKENPISKVEYILGSDGNYSLRITISHLKTLYYDELSTAGGWELVSYSRDDSSRCFFYHEGFYDKDNELIVSNSENSKTVKPGERFYIKFDLLDSIPQAPNVRPVYNETVSMDFTAPVTYTVDNITKDSKGKVVSTKTISLGSNSKGKIFGFLWENIEGTGYSWPVTPDITVTTGSGTTVSKSRTENGADIYEIGKGVTSVTVKVISNYIGSGKCGWKFTYSIQDQEDPISFGNDRLKLVGSAEYGTFNFPQASLKVISSETSSQRYYYLREDVETGIITLLNSSYTPYTTYGDDSNDLKYEKTYRYYVTVMGDIDNAGSTFKDSLLAGTPLTQAVKDKLPNCSNPLTLTMVSPIIATIKRLVATPWLESVDLVFYPEYDSGVRATGYEIWQNGKFVQTCTGKVDMWETYLTVSRKIPYVGAQKFKIRAYYDYYGKTYYGKFSNEITCESRKIEPSSLAVTNINKNQARITIRNGYGVTGNDVYVSSGSSWKKIKTNVNGAFTYKAKKAGSLKYRVVGSRTSGGKYYPGVSSGAFKPAANTLMLSSGRKPNARAYTYATARYIGSKAYYSGNKLKVSGYLVNTRIFDLKSAKVTITVYSQGKKIAKQTFKYKKKVKDYQSKKVTFTFKKAKKDYDLRNGNTQVYITISPNWGF